jgi:hypothetical protein
MRYSMPLVNVGDLIDIQWVRRPVVRFRLCHGAYPYAAASSFRTLCDLLVLNYPDLIDRPSDSSRLVERSSTNELWPLSCINGVVNLTRTTATRQEQDLGVVQSVSHAQHVARQATGRRRVHFEPHPLPCPVLPLWRSVDLFSKRRLRTLVARTMSRRPGPSRTGGSGSPSQRAFACLCCSSRAFRRGRGLHPSGQLQSPAATVR